MYTLRLFTWLYFAMILTGLVAPADLRADGNRKREIISELAKLQRIEKGHLDDVLQSFSTKTLRFHTLVILRKLGADHELDSRWQPGNPFWDQAQAKTENRLRPILNQYEAELFSLFPIWGTQSDLERKFFEEQFTEAELESLLAFEKSDLGRKSAAISVTSMVMLAYVPLISATPDTMITPDIEKELNNLLNDTMSIIKMTDEEEARMAAWRKSEVGKKIARRGFAEIMEGLSGNIQAPMPNFKWVSSRIRSEARALSLELMLVVMQFKSSQASD